MSTAYTPHATAATAVNTRNRRRSNSSAPAAIVVAVRPPETNLAAMITCPPRSRSNRCAHSSARRRRGLRHNRSPSRRSANLPIAYDMLSPTNAPTAAMATTSTRFGAPVRAKTPAVMTTLSLGTSGKNPSIADTRNTIT